MGALIEPNHLSGYCSLVLFPNNHRVRHQFINKIKSFDYTMDSSEKHWRACKRGALPNWAIALMVVIHILSCRKILVKMNITWSNIISLWSIWLVLLISNIPFIIHRCDSDRSHVFLVVLINDLLNSVVRVLLSYGGSHWFKSNSR